MMTILIIISLTISIFNAYMIFGMLNNITKIEKEIGMR